MLEDTYNKFVESWEKELQDRFPGTTWVVARYTDIVTQGYVTQVDGKLLPMGMAVTAINDRQQSTTRLVPNDLMTTMAQVNLTSLMHIVGEQLERQLEQDYPA